MEMIELFFVGGGIIVILTVIVTFIYPVLALQKRFKHFGIDISDEEAKKLTNFY
jgi:flagellar biogenesis protein FliO